MFFKRLKVLWWNHKAWFIVILIVAALGILTIIGIASMESFMAQQTISQLPLEALRILFYSIVGAWAFFWFMSRIGVPLSDTGTGEVKGSDIKVGFNDVIGLSEAKRESLEVVHLIKDRAK